MGMSLSAATSFPMNPRAGQHYSFHGCVFPFLKKEIIIHILKRCEYFLK